jgi:magnesium chelatase subunit I
MTRPTYPFSAIAGQEELKLALIVSAIDPSIGGVLAFGDRGTGKSTTVRSCAAIMPPLRAVRGCRYHCDPDAKDSLCAECRARAKNGPLPSRFIRVPVVDLPLGITEDRVVGALDIERALSKGEKAFETGLLARANRGFLYIDEVNLLEDHIVDLLLDVAASRENVVERDGISLRHPANIVLIGSGNPEEGELRPQLLDRFGLSVEVVTPRDLKTRMDIVRRRDAFDRDPFAFAAAYRDENRKLRRRIAEAQRMLDEVEVSDAVLEAASRLCLALGTDGLRGELALIRAARALASFEGAKAVAVSHLRQIAPASLRHRLRRDPLDEAGSTARVEIAIESTLGL